MLLGKYIVMKQWKCFFCTILNSPNLRFSAQGKLVITSKMKNSKLSKNNNDTLLFFDNFAKSFIISYFEVINLIKDSQIYYYFLNL